MFIILDIEFRFLKEDHSDVVSVIYEGVRVSPGQHLLVNILQVHVEETELAERGGRLHCVQDDLQLLPGEAAV